MQRFKQGDKNIDECSFQMLSTLHAIFMMKAIQWFLKKNKIL